MEKENSLTHCNAHTLHQNAACCNTLQHNNHCLPGDRKTLASTRFDNLLCNCSHKCNKPLSTPCATSPVALLSCLKSTSPLFPPPRFRPSPSPPPCTTPSPASTAPLFASCASTAAVAALCHVKASTSHALIFGEWAARCCLYTLVCTCIWHASSLSATHTSACASWSASVMSQRLMTLVVLALPSLPSWAPVEEETESAVDVGCI